VTIKLESPTRRNIELATNPGNVTRESELPPLATKAIRVRCAVGLVLAAGAKK